MPRVEHPCINVILNSRVERLEGFVGNFRASIVREAARAKDAEPVATVGVGSVVVCTGYKEFDARRITHYGYGKLPNVITSFEPRTRCAGDASK